MWTEKEISHSLAFQGHLVGPAGLPAVLESAVLVVAPALGLEVLDPET